MLVLLVAYAALVLVAPAPPPPSLETGLKATTWYLPLTACTAPPVADDLLLRCHTTTCSTRAKAIEATNTFEEI